jgi:hypothetical protein
MSATERSTTLAERVLALSGVIGSIVLVGIACYELGLATGAERANSSMWEVPPDMASCRVFPDGSKQCVPRPVLEQPSRTECIRACVMRDRLNKVKPT